jgi:hypothetical protein
MYEYLRDYFKKDLEIDSYLRWTSYVLTLITFTWLESIKGYTNRIIMT